MNTVMAENENIHKNHRSRVRKAYIERGGLTGMHEHEILELLLFYAISRRDVNPLAHRLINRFGSLRGVLSASVAELTEFGLTESTAVLLKLAGDIGLELDKKDAVRQVVRNTDEALVICYKILFRENKEAAALICLDAKKRVIKISIKSDGFTDKVNALPKWVVETAFSHKANAVILAHNHPSEEIKPSSRDIDMTVMLENLLTPLGVMFYDHVIVTKTCAYSIRRDYKKSFIDEENAEYIAGQLGLLG